MRTLVLGLLIAAITVAVAAGTAHATTPLERAQTCQQLGACQVPGEGGLTYQVNFHDGDPVHVDIVNGQCAPASQGAEQVVVCLATPTTTRPDHP